MHGFPAAAFSIEEKKDSGDAAVLVLSNIKNQQYFGGLHPDHGRVRLFFSDHYYKNSFEI